MLIPTGMSEQTPTPTPPPSTEPSVLPDVPFDAPACASDAGSLCARVFQYTHASWLSRSADTIVSHTVTTLVIIVVAVVLRFAVHRAIRRIVEKASSGRVPRLLRPLRDRAAASLREAAPQVIERRSQRAQAIGSVLRSFVTLVIYGVAFTLILGEFGVNLAPIIASAGILGVAIGFGAQNLVRDFLSGIFMMLEDQYGVGDVVDLGEAIGTVEAVGLRVTTLRDIAGTVWYVRNGEVLRVGNSSQGYSVAVVDIPVGHSADVDDTSELARNAAVEECAEPAIAAKVLAPPEMLGVQSVTAEGILLRLTIRTRPGEQWAVQRAVAGAVKTAFDDAGVPAPTPFGAASSTAAGRPRP
ncbi:mechanosensitive ion channel family protein [Actinomycetospora termitidis]|uniref:Mechanosensitive ion channel family protein n=1 Tax=Actinomycetospora termitidis TaxID=3053470 RepID=A0ABT7MGX8_9PSEU|nr:mechanosensitive ion channel family protein [Actinomycetospora sp. Odt1-22]MDL5159936.1 mechanosensitive ion channel family protein [Actinomycetospora sp. Odt1-22]